jgi:hypothetical protein
MSDPNAPLEDGSVPADADFAPDIADDDEVASLLPGGSPASGDTTEESRDEVAPDEGAPAP